MRLNRGVLRPSCALWISALVVPTVLAIPAARAERITTVLLWVGGAGGAIAAEQAEAALGTSSTLAPIADLEARRLFVEGGPATRVRERVTAGRERFAALRELPEADALLGEAESIALGELPIRVACPRLIEIARLRLRFAELTHDEARAAQAVLLLRACLATPSAEDAAAIARHAPPPLAPASPLRIESDPPGAAVFVDLQPVGVTPIDLNQARRDQALLDVEKSGLRKAHRVLDGKSARGPQTLAVALAREDGLAELVDRVRDGVEARPADLVELARRVGAAQVLALRAGREGLLDARLFDVARGAWVKPPVELRAPLGNTPLDVTALLAYLAPVPAGTPAAVGAAAASAPTSKAATAAASAPGAGGAQAPAEPVPAYKRWYTWVVGGVLVAGVGAYVIADRIGDDQVTVHVAR